MAHVYQWLSIPITNLAAVTLFLAALVALAIWVGWRKPYRILVRAALISALFTGAFWLLYDVIIIPYMEKLMPILYPGIALLAFIIPLSINKRGIIAIAATILPAMGLTNAAYDQYATLADLLPSRNVVPLTYQEFQHQQAAPTIDGNPVGALVSVDIPASKSGFPARTSLAYIPPAYWSGAHLPVVVMMAGNPGSPGQWFGPLNAQAALQNFQAAHHGVAPIVFSIDATGSTNGNPLCIDGPEYKVHTWLADDVPTGIKRMFTVDSDQNHWTIGGLSYGGTCALQVVTNSPSSYGTFISYAGQGEPIYKDHTTTLKMFFNNDTLLQSAGRNIDGWPAGLLPALPMSIRSRRFVSFTRLPRMLGLIRGTRRFPVPIRPACGGRGLVKHCRLRRHGVGSLPGPTRALLAAPTLRGEQHEIVDAVTAAPAVSEDQ